jgi:hypothetical protein
MHAEVIDRLAKQGPFTDKQAMEIATAIDSGLDRAQYVTVPVLDARLSVLQADIDRRFGRLEADIDRRFGELKADIKVRSAYFTLLMIASISASFANGPLGQAAIEALKRLI